MEADSVQTVVTSPPYWNLRDYGWHGGDPACSHAAVEGRCAECGAERLDCQIGLEATPYEYVDALVDVFREVRRVLRPDGTLWLNLGDTFMGGMTGGSGERSQITSQRNHAAVRASQAARGGPRHRRAPGLKRKDLVGIPWRVALALQADGWWLRMDTIWHKPNPMPESVRDRPSRCHEYLFLLTKSPTYYYDHDAIRTDLAPKTATAYGTTRRSKGTDALGKVASHNISRDIPERRPALDADGNPKGANRRSVWRLDEVDVPSVMTIAQEPYPHSHFATFPSALVEPCVLAGAPAGGLVLDPFVGSGTALEVSVRLGRRAYGIESNPDYLRLIEMRLDGIQLPLVAPGLVDAS